MNGSRENSPDWLRSFQPPPCTLVSLSSDSKSSAEGSPSRFCAINSSLRGSPLVGEDNSHVLNLTEDALESAHVKNSKAKSEAKKLKVGKASSGKRTLDNSTEDGGKLNDIKCKDDEGLKKCSENKESGRSILMLSSDSESQLDDEPTRKGRSSKVEASEQDEDQPLSEKDLHEKSFRQEKKHRMPKKGNHVNSDVKNEEKEEDLGIPDTDTSKKNSKPSLSTSTLPLVLPEKVHRAKALVECEGDSIDLSGDIGAVGRVVFSESLSGTRDMHLDMKGTLYKTKIVPSRTFCVVSFGQSEAKIEAIMNDFIQLKPESNVFEAETMVEGTLEGFSFESEDEVDKIPKGASNQTGQNEWNEEQTNPNTKGKTEKASNVGSKRGRTQGKTQPAKRPRKKSVTSKKAKTKK